MSCTPQEIAEKKRIALERLRAKKQSTSAVVEASSAFYGKSSTKSDAEDTALNTSTKTTINPYQNARILSQPYHLSNNLNKTGSSSTAVSSLNNKKQQVAPIFAKIISCSCYMISETRFVVSSSGFHNKLIDVFKTIPSKGYSNQRPFTMILQKIILGINFRHQHKVMVVPFE